MGDFAEPPLSAPPQSPPKRKNAILRLFDAPLYRDWAFWLIVTWAAIAGGSIGTSPSPTGIPVWLNTLLAVIFFVAAFGVLPAWIRLLVRRWRWRRWQQSQLARQATQQIPARAATAESEHGGDGEPPHAPASAARWASPGIASEPRRASAVPGEASNGLGITAADPTLVGLVGLAPPVMTPVSPRSLHVYWDRIDADGFERLLARLLEQSGSYLRITRLMNVNAADAGRDLQAYRRVNDGLSERHERVIVQAKHWPKRGVSASEISDLVHTKLPLWEGEPVRGLIVATTGSFTQDAVRWVDDHNRAAKRPDIVLWSSTELETLLRRWRAVSAEFGLID